MTGSLAMQICTQAQLMPLDGSSPPISAAALLARLVAISVFIALKALCSLVVKAVCDESPICQ